MKNISCKWPSKLSLLSFMMRAMILLTHFCTFSTFAGDASNVDYIIIEPANYQRLSIIPSYGPVADNGVQYVKIVVVQNDGFGDMSDARIFVYGEDNKLQLISQNYHSCSEENNKCFIEFNASPSVLNHMVVELYYMNSYEPVFREYRIKGLGMLNPNNETGSE